MGNNRVEPQTVDHKDFFYPPGGLLLWIIVFLELATFGVALVVMAVFAKEEPALFHNSREALNQVFGTVNTVLLLTSSFFLATSLKLYKEDNIRRSSFFLRLTMIFGGLFIVLKSCEYFEKIRAGITISTNTFFSFYWILTIFHLLHVVVGLIVLLAMYRRINSGRAADLSYDFEAGCTFWHLCDLIWLLIFPTLYLLF